METIRSPRCLCALRVSTLILIQNFKRFQTVPHFINHNLQWTCQAQMFFESWCCSKQILRPLPWFTVPKNSLKGNCEILWPSPNAVNVSTLRALVSKKREVSHTQRAERGGADCWARTDEAIGSRLTYLPLQRTESFWNILAEHRETR